MSQKFSTYSVIPTEVMLNNKLSSTSKIVYGLISSLCNEKGYCWASNEYLGGLLEITGNRISLIIKELLENNLIESEVEQDYKRKITLRGVLIKHKGGVCENTKGGLQKHKDNKIIEYYKDNTIINSKPAVCEIKEPVRENGQELLNLFYREINPNIQFNNKSQRSASVQLTEKYGIEALTKMILYIKQHQAEQYFPTVTTPIQLRDKMVQIINHANKQKDKKTIIII